MNVLPDTPGRPAGCAGLHHDVLLTVSDCTRIWAMSVQMNTKNNHRNWTVRLNWSVRKSLTMSYLVATILVCLVVVIMTCFYNEKYLSMEYSVDNTIEHAPTNNNQNMAYDNERKEGLKKTERASVSSILYDMFYNEKKSNEIFSWIKLNGLNHPDSTKKLREFRRSGGGWLCSINLIKMLNKDDSVSDLNTSLVLKLVTDAYEGGVYSDGTYSIAKNNKDIEIQNFLKQQLEKPKGKASFYEALDNADILDQGYALYQLINTALEEHGDLIDEYDIYRYKIKYSQKLPSQLKVNLEEINSLPREKQEEISYLVYDSIDFFSYESLVMTKEVKEQYQRFLDKNKSQVFIFTDEEDKLEELNFESLTEALEWQKKSDELLNQYHKKAENFMGNLISQMILDNVSDKHEYLYQYALNTDSIAEVLVILQKQAEESYTLNEDENEDNLGLFSNSHELKHKLESKLSDPSLSSSQKEEIRSAIDTYFNI